MIGGTASMILLNEVGLDFRATKDVDVVLFVEALSAKFANTFWDFIEEGGYNNRQVSSGKPIFYRFWKPRNQVYPEMIELFSRNPDGISLRPGSHLTPIPIAEEVTSLSAILMNESYYNLAITGRRLVEGLPVLSAAYLITFKARAWLDLRKRRENGQQIDEKDIRKHRNDVFRLYQIISTEQRIYLPPEVAGDMRAFLLAVEDSKLNLSQIGIQGFTLTDAVDGLKQVYGLTDSG
ncbi:MAG TPA: hypothetical protein PLU88_00045 [Armatimonadota bacterium]|nr:hypothetical protein [Armatimonadota bacterium]